MRRTYLAAAFIISTLCFITSCSKKSSSAADAPSSNATPGGPVPGAAISYSSVTTTSMVVNWGAATDSVTNQVNLQYKLVRSSSNNIASVSTAEANGTLVMDWTANTTSCAVSGNIFKHSESSHIF